MPYWHDWRSYCLPFFATLLLHAVLFAVIDQGWMSTPSLSTPKPVKTIQASLVTLEKPKPIVKSKPKPKPKTQSKLKPVESAKPKPQAKPKPKPVAEKKEPTKPEKKIDPKEVPDTSRDQALFDELLAQEEAEIQAAEEASLVERYSAQIRQAIGSQWNRPPSSRRDMEVLLEIRLVPNGDLVSVQVLKSSGDAAFDRAAELAVQKVGRFDQLRGMPSRLFEANFRRLQIKFKPEDLRL